MPRLDVSDEEGAARIKELHNTVNDDRYPLSPRIRMLRGILGKLWPKPPREPLPTPKVYAPPKATAAQRPSADQ